MDSFLFQAINRLAGRSPLVDGAFALIAGYGPYLLLGALALLWFWPGGRSQRDRRQRACIIAVLSVAVALLLNQVIIRLWDRPRPFASHAATLLLPPSTEASFPSDHATFGFAVAIAVLLATRRPGALMLGFAVLLAFSRVYTGEHYVSDVVAGALVGGGCAWLLTKAQPYLEPVIAPCLLVARRLHLT